jgi:hypothetical protein
VTQRLEAVGFRVNHRRHHHHRHPRRRHRLHQIIIRAIVVTNNSSSYRRLDTKLYMGLAMWLEQWFSSNCTLGLQPGLPKIYHRGKVLRRLQVNDLLLITTFQVSHNYTDIYLKVEITLGSDHNLPGPPELYKNLFEGRNHSKVLVHFLFK